MSLLNTNNGNSRKAGRQDSPETMALYPAAEDQLLWVRAIETDKDEWAQ